MYASIRKDFVLNFVGNAYRVVFMTTSEILMGYLIMGRNYGLICFGVSWNSFVLQGGALLNFALNNLNETISDALRF